MHFVQFSFPHENTAKSVARILPRFSSNTRHLYDQSKQLRQVIACNFYSIHYLLPITVFIKYKTNTSSHRLTWSAETSSCIPIFFHRFSSSHNTVSSEHSNARIFFRLPSLQLRIWNDRKTQLRDTQHFKYIFIPNIHWCRASERNFGTQVKKLTPLPSSLNLSSVIKHRDSLKGQRGPLPEFVFYEINLLFIMKAI